MSSKKESDPAAYFRICPDTGGSLKRAVLLQITGREEVYIENFRGILEYTDCGILILGKQGRILIEGRYLQIPFYTSEEMKITGQIDQIRYL
ncbi:MAG: YabP/YqfC family sporulation protein [Hominisplanchenecus sp.]